MRCPSCGTENKSGMKFCKKCGCILQEKNYDVVSTNKQQPKEKTSKVLVIAIIVVALVIFGIIAFLLISNTMSTNDNKFRKETDSTIETTIKEDSSILETTVPATTQMETQNSTDVGFKIPNVEGMKSIEAYKSISDLGLKYKTEFEFNDKVPEDYVISQSPSEGKAASLGDTVKLVVSRGEKPKENNNNSSSGTTNSSNNSNFSGDTTDRYGLNVSSHYISRSDISWMSLDEIQMAINEVYAKHGFRFTKAPYKSYFESMDWYHPDTQDMYVIEGRMNKYEIENMKVMGEYRDSISN